MRRKPQVIRQREEEEGGEEEEEKNNMENGMEAGKESVSKKQASV